MKLLQMLVLVAVFPLLSGATTITSGTITITTVAVAGNFNFSGPGFSASGGFGPFVPWGLAVIAPPGTMVGVNGFVSGTDIGGGSATIGGMNFPSVNWGALNMEGPSDFMITGPPITLNAGPTTYQSTFTFNGALCGAQTNGNPTGDVCVVDLPSLTGSGVVTANYILRSDGLLNFTSATYTFVPESGTWLLAGLGLLLAVAVVRRRQPA